MTRTSTTRSPRRPSCAQASPRSALLALAARVPRRIGFGTDAGIFPHGWNAKQFAYMVEWGMTSTEAIQAATVNAADLLAQPGVDGALVGGASLDPGSFEAICRTAASLS